MPIATSLAPRSDAPPCEVEGVLSPASPARRPGRVPRAWLAAALAVWALGVGAATFGLWRYKSTPGAQAAAPPAWPQESSLVRAEDRYTLVMLAHPRCPCTRASMDELASLLEKLGGRARAYVVFLGAPAEAEGSALWQRAASLPGVTPVADPSGAETLAWGAKVSGQVVLYDPRGALAYRGGITDARGHAGDSVGKARIAEVVLRGASRAGAESPVFGCDLFDEESSPR